MAEDKRLNISIPDDLHKRFKIYCVQHGLDMTAVITRLIEKVVAKQEKTK